MDVFVFDPFVHTLVPRMTSTARPNLIAAGLLGFTGVALGAFGAHALKETLAAANMTSAWQTAVLYNLVHAVALAAYITGLSYLARVESGGSLASRWPLALLFVPVVAALCLTTARAEFAWLAVGVFVVWTCWWLRGVLRPASRNIGQIVAGLLAGIVLVDWLAVPWPAEQIVAWFVGLFVLALVMQRQIPAT